MHCETETESIWLPAEAGPQTGQADLLAAAKEAWRDFHRSGWRCAKLLAEIQCSEAWRSAGFGSMFAWAKAELGLSDRGRLAHLVAAGSLGLSHPEVEALPVGAVEAVAPVARSEPERAVALVLEHRTEPAVRAAVRRELADEQHLETEYRTIRATVSLETRNEWQEAVNLVRVHIGAGGVDHPSDDAVIRAIAVTVKQACELVNMPDAILAEVLSGEARCFRCHGYRYLQRHHVIPRSRGGKDAEGVERLAWLCQGCHNDLHQCRDDNWQLLAADMGLGPGRPPVENAIER